MGGLVLVNAVSGAVVDLTGANAAAGTAIQMYANNFTAAQAWRFVAASLIDDGAYVVVNHRAVIVFWMLPADPAVPGHTYSCIPLME